MTFCSSRGWREREREGEGILLISCCKKIEEAIKLLRDCLCACLRSLLSMHSKECDGRQSRLARSASDERVTRGVTGNREQKEETHARRQSSRQQQLQPRIT